MQLFQYFLHFLWDRQSKVSCVFQKGNALIGDVEKHHCRSQHRACSDYLHIKDICNPHKQKNQHLSADTLKAYLAGQRMVRDGTHHSRDIVHNHKGNQCIEQTITAAKEVPQPTSDACKYKLNRVPEFFHLKFLTFFKNVYEKSTSE